MEEKPTLLVRTEDVKRVLSRLFSCRYSSRDEKIEVTDLSLDSLIDYPGKYVRFEVSQIKTKEAPPQELPQRFIYQLYRNGSRAFEHEFRKEIMMLGFGQHLRCDLDKEIRVYPALYHFDPDKMALVTGYPAQKSLKNCLLKKTLSSDDLENVLFPLALLHSYTPLIVDPKDNRLRSYTLDMISEVDMGEIFAQSISALLRSSGKSTEREMSELIQNRFTRLAGNLLYKRGSKGVIHGGFDLESLSSQELLYAGETKIGSFFCDLGILIDPALLDSLEIKTILQRITRIQVMYPRARQEIDMSIKEKIKTLSDSELHPFPAEEDLSISLGLVGVWAGVKRAYNAHYFLSGYLDPGVNQQTLKEQITQTIQSNITLSQRLLEHLSDDQEHGARAAELYRALEQSKFFGTYELEQPSSFSPLDYKIFKE